MIQLRMQGLCACAWVVIAQGGLCGCGAARITPSDAALVALEADQQRLCVDAYQDAGRTQQDACRASVRATWSAYWAARFDGGTDQ